MALASDVVATARRILQDSSADTYSDADLIRLFNDGRRTLLVAKPDVYAVEEDLTLAAGARQSLPATCAFFIDMPRTASGRPIRVAEREYLDAFVPGWRNQAAGDTEHFMYDERYPLFVEVYPPAQAGAVNRIVFAKHVDDVASGYTLTRQEEVHQMAFADYIVGRALLEDAESPANERRGMLHLNLCGTAWNIDLSTRYRASPNTGNEGGKPAKNLTGQ